MNSLFLCIVLVIAFQGSFAQKKKHSSDNLTFSTRSKPEVDTSMFGKWPMVESPVLSDDGKYAMYSIVNQPIRSSTLMIHALESDWRVSLPGVHQGVFTKASRKVVFMSSYDSLCLLTLGSLKTEFIAPVSSFRLFWGKDEWLAYHLNTSAKELWLRNLTSGKVNVYKGVDEYLISGNGKAMVIKTTKDSVGNTSIKWNYPESNSFINIWEGKGVSSMVLDEAGTRLAFLSEDSRCWFYQQGAAEAIELESKQPGGLDSNLVIEGLSRFSKDGQKLFLRLKEKSFPKQDPRSVKVNIWSYADPILQSQQLFELRLKSYQAVINLKKNPRKIVRIQQENDDISISLDVKSDDFVLITTAIGERNERYWSKAAQAQTFVYEIEGEKRTPVSIAYPTHSMAGKYVVGYDTALVRRDIYIYEISSRMTRNLTQSLPVPISNSDIPSLKQYRGLEVAAWLSDDTSVLVYDTYDIWLLDPQGKKAAVNLTHGYGRKNNIVFRLAGFYSEKVIDDKGQLIVTAFNLINKCSGFYRVKLGTNADPQLLSMGNYYYNPGYKGNLQQKAKSSTRFLVTRESSNQSPNLFWTKDFKVFIPISDIYPEKSVNWYFSELLSFKTADGHKCQGILYKPENFQPDEKYPLIIHYYDKRSDELYKYYPPVAPGGGELDIAWFASHGYLVLVTDIHYKIGETGESVKKCVETAAALVSRMPFVDAPHIGIQGHSFGGYETNYLITHSNMFAAAVSSAGVSDLISCYGSLWPGGSSQQNYLEVYRLRIGKTPWEGPNLYVKNSPIFSVHQINAPILMMYNKNDHNVHFEQGLEFFTALRRAGKRAWMLEYDNGGHGVRGEEYKDYVIRMTQFFDHYLKGKPAPKWMTRGIPARMKAVDNGLKLDSEIKTPGAGLSMKVEIDK